MFYRLTAKFRIHAALDNGEHGLTVAVKGLSFVEPLCIALQPRLSQFERLFCISEISVSGAAFVKGHDNIRTDGSLHIDIILRGEGVPRTVDMGRECAAVRRQFADAGKRKNLETAAVREDGSVPADELVQAACLVEYVQTGAQVQMIRVAKYDLCPDIFFQVTMIHTFYRAYGAHRHEDRSLYLTVICCKYSATCRTVCIFGYNLEFRHNLIK